MKKITQEAKQTILHALSHNKTLSKFTWTYALDDVDYRVDPIIQELLHFNHTLIDLEIGNFFLQNWYFSSPTFIQRNKKEQQVKRLEAFLMFLTKYTIENQHFYFIESLCGGILKNIMDFLSEGEQGTFPDQIEKQARAYRPSYLEARLNPNPLGSVLLRAGVLARKKIREEYAGKNVSEAELLRKTHAAVRLEQELAQRKKAEEASKAVVALMTELPPIEAGIPISRSTPAGAAAAAASAEIQNSHPRKRRLYYV